jgi:two-component system C4-dicarboxylate transport sensor histidine kinase DctB
MILRRRNHLILGLAALVAAGALALLVLQAATRANLAEGKARAEATLALTLQGLDGHLGRYQSVPDLLADNERVRALLASPGDPAGRMGLNRWLAQENAELEALDIYVMTPDGVTIAASNHDRAGSFVGQNFTYRPYFQEALAGGKGRFYAIGTTSGVRGYYFAAPVRNGAGQVTGVVAVKIGLDAIEAEWRRQEAQILVTDPEGIVFLSSEPRWLYRGLAPLTEERLERTAALRRYDDLVPVPLEHLRETVSGIPTLSLPDDDGGLREHLVASELSPRAGWTVRVLLPSTPFHVQARMQVLAAMLALGAVAAVALGLLQRRARLAERFALQEAAKAELEARVEARTADLARVNKLIEAEVAERRHTESELRRTQADLIQAGKLAALGQMSAALSHEINQPLAAARNYADSAGILIDRGEPARARANIDQILGLIDRMAQIARHLRHVARKPETPLKDLHLGEAVAEALALLAPRLEGVAVEVDLAPDLPLARGGPVRLQQVLVNLLSNAVDAMADRADRRIRISAQAEGDRVRLAVADTGPGVPAAIAERIFDPFFTTKRVGSGLGLGLSISYNILKDFGGELRVSNEPGGGAVFTLDLARAAPGVAEAAE